MTHNLAAQEFGRRASVISIALPTEVITEILAGLKCGDISLGFGADIEVTPEAAVWRDEIVVRIIDAYEAELARRRS